MRAHGGVLREFTLTSDMMYKAPSRAHAVSRSPCGLSSLIPVPEETHKTPHQSLGDIRIIDDSHLLYLSEVIWFPTHSFCSVEFKE